MAGSLKSMTYTADDGTTFAVRIDESNGELLGFTDVVSGTPVSTKPTVKSLRRVKLVDPTSGATRVLPVGNLSHGVWSGSITSVLLTLLNASGLATALTSFGVVQLIPEIPFGNANPKDTGLTDGDDT
jgi:hypothetical protein